MNPFGLLLWFGKLSAVLVSGYYAYLILKDLPLPASTLLMLAVFGGVLGLGVANLVRSAFFGGEFDWAHLPYIALLVHIGCVMGIVLGWLPADYEASRVLLLSWIAVVAIAFLIVFLTLSVVSTFRNVHDEAMSSPKG